MKTRIPTIIDIDPETGEGVETALPYKWQICSHCSGEGTSSAYLGAFTCETWNEMDPEWQDDYIAGRFDRACEHCENGKVRKVDWPKLTRAQRKAWNAQCRADAEADAADRSERFMYSLGDY